MDISLHLELAGGRREKFLWLLSDGGEEILAAAFERTIPGRWAGPDDHPAT
jgi:hypothetical protein